ncbi:ankycorbin isoform X2 [Spea bombifrons]|uniref:ankycorbin isoform X2 n=1 Tax=Spea bombifrons TaxID=233779 RepID=UPI00234A137D|nr:ankycorbin isoform X2 [Spea bombifrons]
MKSLKAKFRKSDTNEWSKNDDRLLQAVDHGEADKVAALLGKKGVVATKLDSEGKTAFHLAAAKGNGECLRVILAHSVDVSSQDAAGRTALHLAILNNHLDCAKKLLQSKTPVDCTDVAGKTPLHYAVANGSIPALQLLTEQKCPLNVKDAEGNTPLLISILHGHTEVLKYLLDHKADINLKDKNGRTPLILACESGNLNMVDILVHMGADLKATDALGHDALHYSRVSGNLKIVNLLLSKLSQESGMKTPTKPVQLSDMSTPLSSTSTPLSPKGQVFFPDQPSKDDSAASRLEYKDRLSDSTGDDSLFDVSSEAEHQDAVSLLQAKVADLTLLNKELQEKLQEKVSNEPVVDISCDSFHSTQAELSMSLCKNQDAKSPAVISENSDVSFDSQPETASSELKMKHLEKAVEDLQRRLNQSEEERKKLEDRMNSVSSSFRQSVDSEVFEEPPELIKYELHGLEEKNLESAREKTDVPEESEELQENARTSKERLLLLEELEALNSEYKDAQAENERKEMELRDLKHQLDTVTESMVKLVSVEQQEERERSYRALIEQINQENVKLSDMYQEKVEELEKWQKELESQKQLATQEQDRQVKDDMARRIEELSSQVSDLSLLYSEAQVEVERTRQASRDLLLDFIQKDEHAKIVQEIKESKEKVEKDLGDLMSEHTRTLEEVCQLKQLEKEMGNSPLVSEQVKVIDALKNTLGEMEVERKELRVQLASKESDVSRLQEELEEQKSIAQETMVVRKASEQRQASLEEEISTLSAELADLMKEKERLSMNNGQVAMELVQLKGEKESLQSQLRSKEQEIHGFQVKYDKAQEELNEMKKFTQNTSKLEEEKDKKINELSKEVSKLKEALNSLSQLSFSSSTPKRQSQQLEAMQQQVKQLQNQLAETKKQHQDIVSVYRMHLLYAVQGQMDEDVQKVLKQILTMCKSQSQKI